MFAENKYLIVGLGNPGNEYANTRHNAGFIAVDTLIKRNNTIFSQTKLSELAQFKLKNKHITVIKPSTFMNLSGQAVRYYLHKENVSINNLLIISDDIALPFGQIRIRKKGGAGGHNGLQDIIDTLETSDFARVRIGIGNSFIKGYQSDYVLGQWSSDETEQLRLITERAAGACEAFTLNGIDISMNIFNKQL